MNDDPWANFLTWERASRDTIDFKTIYVDMADDLVAGLLLSQIVYWYLPSKKGGSKLRVFKDGYYWIAKARHEWWDEIRVKTRQIDRAIIILEKKGIIISHLYRFNNAPTTHIRIIKGGFLTAWDTALARFDETVKSETPSDPFSPNLQFDLTDSSSGFDETVKSDLPESVQSLTETTIDSSEITAEINGDFSEKPNPDLFDLALKTERARDRYGHYVVPSSAGGDFALGDRLVAVACARLGRSEPEGQKRKNACAFFEKALRAEDLLQGDVAMLEKAVEEWLDPEGEYAFFLPQYELTTKHELALRHFGIVLSKAKVQVTVKSDRRAYDVEVMEASLAALEERKAARPPPIEGDVAWETAKRELRLQMTKPDFDVWIRDTVGLGREDGIYTVAVPDARARDWLESRLKKTAERTLIGILDESVEVRFEVET